MYLFPKLSLWASQAIGPYGTLCSITSALMTHPSAGRRWHLVIVGTFEESRVAGVHLEGSFAWDIWGTPSARPGLWVQELTRVVRAVAEARAVEIGMARLVDLRCCVALHEQVDRHDTCTLQWGEMSWKNIWNKSLMTHFMKITGSCKDKELDL